MYPFFPLHRVRSRLPRGLQTMNNAAQSPSQLELPDGTAGFGLSVPPSEQSVQDLAGILSTL